MMDQKGGMPVTVHNLPRSRAVLKLASLVVLAATLAACAPGIPAEIDLRVIDREEVRTVPGESLEALRFETEHGDTIEAYLRRPSPEAWEGMALPAVVLIAGRETGREAAAAIPGPLEGVVLAVEYPDALPETLAPGETLRELPAMRRSAYRMPGILRGAISALEADPEIDGSRIILIGVSFGVPFAAPAARDERLAGVGLHYGGADLAAILRRNLDVEPAWWRGVLSWFGATVFRRLEPGRHVGHISPTPLLIINGMYDYRIPEGSVELLVERAGEPVRFINLPTDHLMPGDAALMRELADSTVSHFSDIFEPREVAVPR